MEVESTYPRPVADQSTPEQSAAGEVAISPERTPGEKVFDALGISELADAGIDYKGTSMTAASYVGEQGNPKAVAHYGQLRAVYDHYMAQGIDPYTIPAFANMASAEITRITDMLGAQYDEQEQRWLVPERS